MNKQEYILELIHKGHSDEEIELLVKDKFPEEEIIPFMPEPAAPVNLINSSNYTSISSDGTDTITVVGMNSNMWNLISSQSNPDLNQVITFQFKSNCDVSMPSIIFTDGTKGFTYQIASLGLTFTAGHYYTLANGADPVDLGTTLSNSSMITPQEAFDQTWDAVKKVNENIPSGLKGSTITFEDGTTLVL